MNARERFLFGAAGASAPSLLNLVLIDAVNVLGALTPIVAVVYLLRITVLAALGGIVSWGQKDLPDAWKCIQVGIAAPALFMAGLNGLQVAKATAWGITPAYAQSRTAACDRERVLYFARPVETKDEQVQRAVYGRPSARTWFVVLQYHQQIVAARDQVRLVADRRTFPQIVNVYCAPDRRQPATPFAVVVGEHLLQKDADALLTRVLSLGFVNAGVFNVAEAKP